MNVQYEIKITGRVQGVGFRYYVQNEANKLGLKGWVKNTVEGDVLVMIQGDEVLVDTFIDYLSIGPALSRVDKISKYKMKLLKKLARFQIKSF